MPLRKAIFWIHLFAGLISGGVIAVMSATGIAIAFEEEILKWQDRKVSRRAVAASPGAVMLPIAELRQRIESEHPGERISSIARFRDPGRAWEVYLDGEGPLYVDPFTGGTQESRAHGTHEILHELEEWHRWLGAKDDLNPVGRLITGICNLMLVVLCVTGIYLWIPRRWSWRALRPLLFLNTRYKSKARDFNWHHVFGFWPMPLVLVLSATAVVISFEWGHRLPFTLAGEEAPKSRNYGMMAVPPPFVPAPAAGVTPLPLETGFAKVAAGFPDWESITLEVVPDSEADPSEPLEFGVTVPDPMPSRGYIPVKSDPFTGDILQQVRFQDRSAGLQARVWIRFLHTGGAFGLPGKIAASIGCVAALVLVWTGFALSWRRFFLRRRPPPPSTRAEA